MKKKIDLLIRGYLLSDKIAFAYLSDSRAEQSRAEQSRAEQSRAELIYCNEEDLDKHFDYSEAVVVNGNLDVSHFELGNRFVVVTRGITEKGGVGNV